MTTHKTITLSLAGTALGLALFTTSACTNHNRYKQMPSTAAGQTMVEITPSAKARPASDELLGSDPSAPAQWTDLKNIPYEESFRFYAGFPTVESAVDAQIATYAAKRETLRTFADKRAWDFTMKELRTARASLHALGTEMGAANAENWQRRLDRIDVAWQRTQVAVGKLSARPILTTL